MTRKMVIWGNGTITTGRTWEEIEDTIRDKQWDKYPDELEFREEMARRAMVWSGTTLVPSDLGGTSYRFLRALERAGILRMEVGNVEAKT